MGGGGGGGGGVVLRPNSTIFMVMLGCYVLYYHFEIDYQSLL